MIIELYYLNSRKTPVRWGQLLTKGIGSGVLGSCRVICAAFLKADKLSGETTIKVISDKREGYARVEITDMFGRILMRERYEISGKGVRENAICALVDALDVAVLYAVDSVEIRVSREGIIDSISLVTERPRGCQYV